MVIYRKAKEEDVDSLFTIIEGYARKGIMLPRSKATLIREIEHFAVAEIDERIIGCGSLCRLGNDLVEIRSLAVSESYKGQGIGRKLVEMLTNEASRMNIPQIMALTYETGFFTKLGFQIVSKDIFPEKVWRDCVFCPKQNCCDEIAVMKRLD